MAVARLDTAGATDPEPEVAMLRVAAARSSPVDGFVENTALLSSQSTRLSANAVLDCLHLSQCPVASKKFSTTQAIGVQFSQAA